MKWFHGKKIATSYPGILSGFLKENGVNAEIHVITGSVEVAPGIGLADAIFDIVSSGSTLVSNRLKEVEVVMKSEALLIGNKNMSEEKQEILRELLFRMDAVKTAEDKKYVLMNAPKEKLDEIVSVLPGHEEPHGNAFGTRRLVLGTYGARREVFLGDYRKAESAGGRRHSGAAD